MFELKACIVCLKSDVKVFSMNTGQLRNEYNLASGLKVSFYKYKTYDNLYKNIVSLIVLFLI